MTLNGFHPDAIARNIPPGDNDPAIVPCGVIPHLAVSLADSLFGFFSGPSGGVESHFYVRFDGTFEQYRSIFFEADAQADGNSFNRDGIRVGFVSIETQGVVDENGWTVAQLAAIEKIIRWVHAQPGVHFPLEKCSAWNDPGIGYHAQFPEWNPHNHSCPAPIRIRQFDEILIPRLKGATMLNITTEDADLIVDRLLARFGKGKVIDPRPDHTGTLAVEVVLDSIWTKVTTLENAPPVNVTAAALKTAMVEAMREIVG